MAVSKLCLRHSDLHVKCNTQNAGSRTIKTFHFAPQPNCQVNADATKGHAFGILMALGCTLRPGGLRRRLPW